MLVKYKVDFINENYQIIKSMIIYAHKNTAEATAIAENWYKTFKQTFEYGIIEAEMI